MKRAVRNFPPAPCAPATVFLAPARPLGTLSAAFLPLLFLKEVTLLLHCSAAASNCIACSLHCCEDPCFGGFLPPTPGLVPDRNTFLSSLLLATIQLAPLPACRCRDEPSPRQGAFLPPADQAPACQFWGCRAAILPAPSALFPFICAEDAWPHKELSCLLPTALLLTRAAAEQTTAAFLSEHCFALGMTAWARGR